MKKKSVVLNSINHPLTESKFSSGAIDIYSCASDASFYRYIPKAVARPDSIGDLARLMQWCRSRGKHITFRAAGTSLSGQAVTDGILVDISRGWDHFEIRKDGEEVYTQPGVIGGKINKSLMKYGRKLGPDPASIDSCMVGGMIANNSSGMCSGTAENPYNSVKALQYMLPNGVMIDSSLQNSNTALKEKAPEIYRGLAELRKEILNSERLVEKIRWQYRIKNTIGYSLNAFIDENNPADILTGLMFGSEGTLGFIASALFGTVPNHPHKHTGMLLFDSVVSAGKALPEIRESGTSALEIMDYSSLRSIKDKPGVPAALREIPPGAAVLLFEYRAPGAEELNRAIERCNSIIRSLDLIHDPLLTENEADREALWMVRQGLLTSLGANRKPGETLIIEDLAFEIEKIPEAVAKLNELFRRFDYQSAGIYGHGMDGNIHFIISQSFESGNDINRYAKFTDAVCEMTLSLEGSLKAEHGTGRNMAPYVEKQWGSKAYGIMRRIKELVDPLNIMNPGVIINKDGKIHLKNLKSYLPVNDIIDNCIECGFCESVCPSAGLTLSPRKRIVVLREMARSKNDTRILEELSGAAAYFISDTCATDGLCSLKCPIGINTGDMVKLLRSEKNSKISEVVARISAKNIQAAAGAVGTGLGIAGAAEKMIGAGLLKFLTGKMNMKSGRKFPQWNAQLPGPATISPSNPINARAVYFPSCISRIMGQPKKNGEKSIVEVMIDLARLSGVDLRLPSESSAHCCGMAFSSKGFQEEHRAVAEKFIEAAFDWTDGGELPLVTDSSSCAYTMKQYAHEFDGDLRIMLNDIVFLDSIEFAWRYLLPNLNLRKLNLRIAVHPVCSAEKQGLNKMLIMLCKKCAKDVFIPENAGCCGFAGDRGVLVPELTQSATEKESREVAGNAESGFSSNIPCEVGMTSAAGIEYRSFLYLLYKSATAG